MTSTEAHNGLRTGGRRRHAIAAVTKKTSPPSLHTLIVQLILSRSVQHILFPALEDQFSMDWMICVDWRMAGGNADGDYDQANISSGKITRRRDKRGSQNNTRKPRWIPFVEA